MNQKIIICVNFLLMILTVRDSFAYGNDCYKNGTCYQLTNTTCFGITLPYKYTSFGIFDDENYSNEQDIRQFLLRWQSLQNIPRCWTSLQSLLCTLYLPKCDDGKVYFPSYEMCKTARNNCKFFENHISADKTPHFLNCESEIFKPTCRNSYKDLKFNSSPAQCKYPLVTTDDRNVWHPGIEGCGLQQCSEPRITSEDDSIIQTIVKYGSTLNIILLAYSILTFVVNWKSSNAYPIVILFYFYLCLFFFYVGWSLQFYLFLKSDIVCRRDNTTRYGESNRHSENSFPCLLSFSLIYYTAIAAPIWFACLQFFWYYKFKGVSNFTEFANSMKHGFHIFTWSIAFILYIIIIISGEIDGSSMLGICFVGFKNPIYRIILAYLPIVSFLGVGFVFGVKNLQQLLAIHTTKSSELVKNKSASKITFMITKLLIFIIYLLFTVVYSIFYHIYYSIHAQDWEDSLDHLIMCSLVDVIREVDHEKAELCKRKMSPNLSLLYIQLLLIFGIGFVSSMWTLTTPSFAAWRRWFLKICKANQRTRLKKHEVISKAYIRKDQITMGYYTPSFGSMHADPVNMNLTSASSQELSTSWRGALPHFLSRRGALTNEDLLNLNGDHYLQDFRSNNNRLHESSMSDSKSTFLQIDTQWLASYARHPKRKTKKERAKLTRKVDILQFLGRRNSDTSNQSITSMPMRSLIGSNQSSRQQQQKQPINQSTSTGDLNGILPMNGGSFPGQILPNQQMMGMPFFPYAPAPTAMYYGSMVQPRFGAIGGTMNQMPFRPRAAKAAAVVVPSFTHGMSEQTGSLVNPLEEKRRPDSRMIVGGSGIGLTAPLGSRMMRPPPMLAAQASIFAPRPPIAGASGMPIMPVYPYFNPYIGGIYGDFGSIGSRHVNRPMMPPNFGQHMDVGIVNDVIDDQIVKEREACKALVTGVDSASETGDIFPIMISDSDSELPISTAYAQSNDFRKTQAIVEQRMQQVVKIVDDKEIEN